MRILPSSVIALLLTGMLVSDVPAQQPPPSFAERLLRDHAGFSSDDIKAVMAGRAVARQMPMRDGQTVNVFGAVRIAAPIDVFVAELQHFDRFERQLGIDQAGVFQNPPTLDDLRSLTLAADDIKALRNCHPGDCDLQLTAAAMATFRTQVDWSHPDAPDAANRLFRNMLFQQLAAYRAGGYSALAPYADRSKPTSIGPEFAALLAPGDLPFEAPGLVEYLSNYPHASLPGATDFFYWNNGQFGMKPTVRLNHVTMQPMSRADAPSPAVRYVVSTSQIYADHYFSATLELRTIVADPDRPGTGFFLFYTTRSDVPGLSGFLGEFLRPIVRRRARSGMEKYLARTKDTVERHVSLASTDR